MRRRRSGRMLVEAYGALGIIAVVIGGAASLFHQGGAVSRRVAAEEAVRIELANRLARIESQARAGQPPTAETAPLTLAEPPGLKATLQVAPTPADGLTRLRLTARWRLGELSGEVVRERLLEPPR